MCNKLILTARAVMLMGQEVGQARADITISIAQDGTNVVATGSGSIDLMGLTHIATLTGDPLV